jgi:hypothetical protein
MFQVLAQAHCAKPTLMASLMLRSSKFSILLKTTLRCYFVLLVQDVQPKRIMNPPTMNAVATGMGANKCALIYFPKTKS